MKKQESKGFTLVEMAVVIVIMGFIIGSLMVPITAQTDIRSYRQTNQTIDEIKQALIGYVIINGRLPCPASDTSNGIEDPVGGGLCNNAYDGFIPSATLGLTPTDANGYVLDGWSGSPSSRIRYAVTKSDANAFTTQINSLSLNPDLHVCATGSGISASACSGVTLSTNAVAIIFSLGKNSGTGGTNTDEAPNLDNNITFVNHDNTPTFDDQMTWISYPILVTNLVNAGKLP